MSENALISVIVPVYSVEKYIDKCVDSIRNQTYKDIEIILVDDESPDNCPQICDHYATIDKRIRVIHRKNGGLSLARNSGLDVATGEYVAFVDSDDYISLDRFEKMMRLIKENDADVCLEGNCRDRNGKISVVPNVLAGKCFEEKDVVNALLPALIGRDTFDKNYAGMSVWRGLFKRSIIQDNGIRFESERQWPSEDLLFDLQYYKYVKKAIISRDSGYYYRFNEDSLTHKGGKEKLGKYDNLYLRVVRECKDFSNSRELIQRMQLTYVFNYKSVLEGMISQMGKKESISLCKEITYRKIISEVVNEYPIKNMPIKKKMYFFTIRKHMGRFLYYLIKLNSNF